MSKLNILISLELLSEEDYAALLRRLGELPEKDARALELAVELHKGLQQYNKLLLELDGLVRDFMEQPGSANKE